MDGRLDISVVMCTWNGVRFLQEQLDSILDQTYPVREIIVQDDGSTDGTWDLLKQYSRLHPYLSQRGSAWHQWQLLLRDGAGPRGLYRHQ